MLSELGAYRIATALGPSLGVRLFFLCLVGWLSNTFFFQILKFLGQKSSPILGTDSVPGFRGQILIWGSLSVPSFGGHVPYQKLGTESVPQIGDGKRTKNGDTCSECERARNLATCARSKAI